MTQVTHRWTSPEAKTLSSGQHVINTLLCVHAVILRYCNEFPVDCFCTELAKTGTGLSRYSALNNDEDRFSFTPCQKNQAKLLKACFSAVVAFTSQTNPAHMSLQRSHGCAGLIRDYCLFVGGALATAVWFLHHHYWFLNIQIQTHGLRFLCQVILAGLLPATLLPGLVMRPGLQSLVGPFMLGQVSCSPEAALSLIITIMTTRASQG